MLLSSIRLLSHGERGSCGPSRRAACHVTFGLRRAHVRGRLFMCLRRSEQTTDRTERKLGCILFSETALVFLFSPSADKASKVKLLMNVMLAEG